MQRKPMAGYKSPNVPLIRAVTWIGVAVLAGLVLSLSGCSTSQCAGVKPVIPPELMVAPEKPSAYRREISSSKPTKIMNDAPTAEQGSRLGRI